MQILLVSASRETKSQPCLKAGEDGSEGIQLSVTVMMGPRNKRKKEQVWTDWLWQKTAATSTLVWSTYKHVYFNLKLKYILQPR